MKAARCGYDTPLELLIQAGAYVNEQNQGSQTAMILTAMSGCVKCINLPCKVRS